LNWSNNILPLLKKNRFTVFLLCLALFMKLFSFNRIWVEKYYATGIYPYISRFLRFLFGWIPFSLGDVFYFLLSIYLLYKIIRFIRLFFKHQMDRHLFFMIVKKLGFYLLLTYVVFMAFWGLNYSRAGIAYQLQLQQAEYSNDELKNLTQVLLQRLDSVVQHAKTGQREELVNRKELWKEATVAYDTASVEHPYMHYTNVSCKKNLYYNLANYIGYSGYYNPFSGEAQLNATIPGFLYPNVMCHEMAHQLGYASESEANFVGYLACKKSKDNNFQYSTYYDMLHYALYEMAYRDTTIAKELYAKAPQQFRDDRKTMKQFYERFKNPIEPIISWLYDKYLKANDQDAGKLSYNQVIGLLIAYQKKYGDAAL
jgi:hypothetical protein